MCLKMYKRDPTNNIPSLTAMEIVDAFYPKMTIFCKKLINFDIIDETFLRAKTFDIIKSSLTENAKNLDSFMEMRDTLVDLWSPGLSYCVNYMGKYPDDIDLELDDIIISSGFPKPEDEDDGECT